MEKTFEINGKFLKLSNEITVKEFFALAKMLNLPEEQQVIKGLDFIEKLIVDMDDNLLLPELIDFLKGPKFQAFLTEFAHQT